MRILYNTEGKSGEPITIEKSDTLTDGSFIFSYTQSQNLNTIDLSSLENGEGMFWNSNLSDSTLEDVATTIKEYTDGSTHVIDLGNVSDSSIVMTVEGKGWTVKSFDEGKYTGCSTVADVNSVDVQFLTNDIDENGVWTESLDDLTNGHYMFYNCSKLTSFTSDLPSLTNGNQMFARCTNLISFNSDVSSLQDGYHMFQQCSNLTSFTSDLSSLMNGTVMFGDCSFTTFTSDLSSLTDGYGMFVSCGNLTSFSANLSSLTDGRMMFYYCKKLESFTSDLPSLMNGDDMFQNCSNLTSFSSELSKLTSGNEMFYKCTALTSFNSDLPSLIDGERMFQGCNLNDDSIVRIANSLPLQWKSEIHIGNLGESINNSIIEACELMGMKGWTVKHGDDDKVYTNQRYIPSNKYDGCKNTDDMTEINSTLGTDAINGFWIHPLKDLEDGRSLFLGNRSINNFCADLSSLKYGGRMFYSINGSEVDSLINFCSSMPSLLDGESMFGCDNMLKSFNGGLKSLTNGFEMFYDCIALSVFNEDLTTLTNGAAMFRNCASLTELNFDLPSMVDGSNMFNVSTQNYPSSYTSFKGNLSSLVQGHSMFKNRLRSFDGSLSSLEIGKDTFSGCCLDKKSIKKIASSIKRLPVNPSWTYPDEYYTAQKYTNDQSWWSGSWGYENRGIITLGIDSRLEADNELQDYLKQIEDKNWEVEVEYNEIDSGNKIKYINCTKPENVSTVEPNYKTVDVINGVWSEPLPKLLDGNSYSGGYQIGMFQQNTQLVSFNTDLSSLVDGEKMFYICSNLTTFNSDLSALEDGYQMFDNCKKLTSFTSDLCSLTNGQQMFYVCTALTSFTSDLSSLTNGNYMFYNCSNLTTVTADMGSIIHGREMFCHCSNLKSFSSDGCVGAVNLNSITYGQSMFENTGLISFNSDLKSLTDGMYMFKGCSYLESFGKKETPINLEKLDIGTQMFSNCGKLNEVNCTLKALTTAGYMFSNCSSLTRFDADLSKLQYAGGMFEYSGIKLFSNEMRQVTEAGRMFSSCMALESFTSKLDNLKHGEYMFNGCSALTSFDVDISNVTDGHYMFNGCTSLTYFESDLTSLTNGRYMFRDCKLDSESIQCIAENINDLASQNKTGVIHIGHADDVPSSILYECYKKLTDKGWDASFNDKKYEGFGTYDVSETNGYIPDAYKNGTDSWNTLVLTPYKDVLKISIVNEKGEMLNDE